MGLIALPRRLSALESLPDDLILHIFSFISTRRQHTLSQCMRVCRRLYDVLGHIIYRRLVFVGWGSKYGSFVDMQSPDQAGALRMLSPLKGMFTQKRHTHTRKGKLMLNSRILRMTGHPRDRGLDLITPPSLPALQTLVLQVLPLHIENNLHRDSEHRDCDAPCMYLRNTKTVRTVVIDGVCLYSSRSVWRNVPRSLSGFDRVTYIVHPKAPYSHTTSTSARQDQSFQGIPLHLAFQPKVGVKEVVIVFLTAEPAYRFQVVDTTNRLPHGYPPHDSLARLRYWDWIGPLMYEIGRALTWASSTGAITPFKGDLIFVNAGSLSWKAEPTPVLDDKVKSEHFKDDMQELLHSSFAEIGGKSSIQVRCRGMGEYMQSEAREGEFKDEQLKAWGVRDKWEGLHAADYQ